MGKIVVHAGMHKTGSSSIQTWLRRSAAELAAERAITPLTGKLSRSGEIRLVAGEGRLSMNSWTIFADAERRPGGVAGVAGELCELLARRADALGTVVFSAEALCVWIARGEAALLDPLEALAREHEVRVAYYVRPQHTALEAAWKAGGFRSGARPSEFLAAWGERLDHARTLELVRERSPTFGFTIRPFRRDLLEGGDAVVDFARHLLGIDLDPREAGGVWRNPALPLELANAMHGAPPELFEHPEGEPVTPMAPLRLIASRADLAPDALATRSRRILQQACHRRYEEGNLRLLAELGWKTDHWVPAVEDEEIGDEASFERLDELWAPRAGGVELALLHGAVARLLGAQRAERAERRRAG